MDERITYCIVPSELAEAAHEPLRKHFGDEPRVRVIVERRWRDRRARDERRADPAPSNWEERPSATDPAAPGREAEEAAGDAVEQRRIRSAAGRRAGDRRARMVPLETPPLPRRLRRYAEQIQFFERIEPHAEEAEDADTARIVTRVQAGDRDAFGDIYLRYFDRVHAYLRVLFRDNADAEDAAQEVFAKLLESIAGYELRAQPFRAYLFRVVRNQALTELKRQGKTLPYDPAALAAKQEEDGEPEELPVLDWITDPDLFLFVERLPVAQRQVVTMRFLLDMNDVEIGEVLGRTREDVRALQFRAVQFLRKRLAAIGRAPSPDRRSPMRSCPNQAFVLRERRFALWK